MGHQVKYEFDIHRGDEVILIKFANNPELNKRVKALIGVKWSQTKKAWYVLDNALYRHKFGLKAKIPIGKEVLTHIQPVNQVAMFRLVEVLQLKAYSERTLITYRNEFAQLLYLLKGFNVDDLSPERLRAYFLYCVNTLKLSENTIHSRLNAVKFYFEQVLRREKFFVEIPRPKRPYLLPNVLAISQVERLFSKLENLKHKTMLFLAYSAGLRVSEVVNLRDTPITDVYSVRT